MNYPNGIKRRHATINNGTKNATTYANRGMSLEEDINVTNDYYLEVKRANIHKKPTPIQIVNVNYPKRSAAVITEGYFQAKATTDYNGIYNGKYIDFEAKETTNKTSFPLSNVHDHQVEHMESILQHGGICFIIIRFQQFNETYFLPAETLIQFWDTMLNGGRKSIPYKVIQRDGQLIPFKYNIRVDYLNIVDQLYF